MMLLSAENYDKAVKLLNKAKFNTLFARAVLDGHVKGKVFVDSRTDPETCLILHPYGMSLLLGKTDNEEFNAWLEGYMLNKDGSRLRPEWLQIHPATWKPVIEEILGKRLIKKKGAPEIPNPAASEPNKVIEYTRVNFKFDSKKYKTFRASLPQNGDDIIRTDRSIFQNMVGTVIPKFFWRDATHFLKEGVGFTLMRDGKPATTAFCAFRQGKKFEIGIETAQKYRGMRLARYVCVALIDYSLENKLEPVWSCRLENAGSYRLAQKLGFEPELFIPYYQLVGPVHH